MNRIGKILGLAGGAALAVLPASGGAQNAPPTAEEAPIALLVDLSSGQELHGREAARRFLPASITKVMTAFVAFELIRDGRLSVDQTFRVRPETAQEWSGKGSTMFVEADQAITVDQLLRGINTVSANDGAVVLAEGVAGSVEGWLELMNRKAAEIGMSDSHFGTPNGWPDEGRTFTSARDLTRLADALVTRHPELYRRYFGLHGFSFNGRTQANRDPVTGTVPGADGMKTGFTREAGYNFLGSAERDGRRLVMVVAGTQNGLARRAIARSYLEWGFAGFDSHPLFPAGHLVGEALVQQGSKSRVGLRLPRGLSVSVPAGQEPQLAAQIRYRGPLRAPIAAGQPVAVLAISGAGIAPYTVPLEAAETVERASLFQRLLNGLAGLVPA